MVQFRRGGAIGKVRSQADTSRVEIASRRGDMDQMAAISAFEGMRPKPDFERLRNRYVSGEISATEFKNQVAGRWKRNG